MYKEFYIHKRSNTYAETLEAFGVAILIEQILERLDVVGRKVIVEDKGLYHMITTNKEITDQMLDTLSYFQIIKFIIKDNSTTLPENIGNSACFDYPAQKAIVDNIKERKNQALAIKDVDLRKKEYLKVIEEQLSEFGEKIDAEFDVYREIKGNPYASFTKLYLNLHEHQDRFSNLIREILSHYALLPVTSRSFRLVDEKPTAQQLFNPNQGKGLNKSKANNASMGNLKSSWIAETMKMSGALKMMSVQYVKVGSGYDLKVYVPEFNHIQLSKGIKLITEFKRHLKSASPIKLDIINILNLTIEFIKQTPDYKKGRIKDTIKGFHSVYQKDLGQNKAVANISFINTPEFITYSNREEGHEWIDILESQKNIIKGIEEKGDSTQGLQNYRNFLGSVGNAALEYFAKFSYWYASYVMHSLDREKYYVKPFKAETLTKLYTCMDSNLTEIIQNEGFQAVAQAIRRSTVTLQYTPKENRKFEIRYGLAQQLQNKSKSKDDLATFVGEFVTRYNAELANKVDTLIKGGITSQNAAKSLGRANVKDTELLQLYALLDNHPPHLIGALLASYGFALTKKEAPKEETTSTEDIETEN
uniref:Uncharacterized protein n=1 Tax=Roseihalotalea indica TaxID=2867963 RepID=A0AA49GHV6_9BACT|nr:hypothetical protein K4G66_18715 [Tunicatimonas sp. TK19036]